MATFWENTAHSAYEMFSWYKYLIVSLVFSHLGFWSGNLFLIAPFPDLCLLVPFQKWLKFTIGLFQRGLISMQINFNSLQKPGQMSERKCQAVFLKDNKWSLAQCVQIFCQPLILWESANSVLSLKAQITHMWINFQNE